MTPQAHRRYVPPRDPPAESLLSTWLIGGAALVLWGFFLVFLLPALVS
jgi:hypothetical protein